MKGPRAFGFGKRYALSMDHLTPEKRSWNMSRIRGKDTNPEVLVRSMLHRDGDQRTSKPISLRYLKVGS
jgi:hypothetical protein